VATQRRSRDRPKRSKDKTKPCGAVQRGLRKRGRPEGSKNKPEITLNIPDKASTKESTSFNDDEDIVQQMRLSADSQALQPKKTAVSASDRK
jgi:hypothetical protein